MSDSTCPNCAAPCAATDLFCSRCGRPRTPSPAPSDSPYPSAYPPPPATPLPATPPPAAPSTVGAPPAWGAQGAQDWTSAAPVTAYDPVGALREGWSRFSADPGRLLIPVLVGSIVQGIVWTIYYVVIIAALLGAAVTPGSSYETSARVRGAVGVALVLVLILTAVVVAATQLVYAGWAKGALGVADGARPSMGEMYAGWRKAPVLVLCLIFAVCGVLSGYVFYIPILILGFLGQFAVFDMIDARTGVLDSITRSSRMVLANPGPILLFDLLAGIALAVGALPCGLGLLIAIPVTLVGHARTYRAFAPPPTA